MRIHGDKVLRRRSNVTELRECEDARLLLEDDFHCLCGYCGKNQKVMHQKLQIDHFVPRSRDPKRERDYYNLVLACKKCNLSKSDKWPTNNIKLPHDGTRGFVDPASDDYDNHLERNEDGYIIAKTNVGKSMCEMLHFDIRRTDIYWKCIQIKNQLSVMKVIFMNGLMTEEEKDIYIRISIIFEDYIDEAFEKGE